MAPVAPRSGDAIFASVEHVVCPQLSLHFVINQTRTRENLEFNLI